MERERISRSSKSWVWAGLGWFLGTVIGVQSSLLLSCIYSFDSISKNWAREDFISAIFGRTHISVPFSSLLTTDASVGKYMGAPILLSYRK